MIVVDFCCIKIVEVVDLYLVIWLGIDIDLFNGIVNLFI